MRTTTMPKGINTRILCAAEAISTIENEFYEASILQSQSVSVMRIESDNIVKICIQNAASFDDTVLITINI